MFKTIRRMIHWCAQFRPRLYIGFVYSFLSVFFTAMQFIVASQMIAKVFQEGSASIAASDIWLALGLMALLILLRFLFDYLRARCQESISYELAARDRLEIGEMLKRVPLGFFDSHDTGLILSALTNGMNTLENMGIRMLDDFIGGYISFLCVFVCLLFFNVPIALISLVGIFISFAFLVQISKHSTKNAPIAAKSNVDLSGAALEYVRGLPVVKSFGQEGTLSRSMREAGADSRKIHLEIEKGYIPTACLHLLTLRLCAVGMIAASAYLGMMGEMSLPTLLVFFLMSLRIFGAIEPISDSAHVLSIIDDTLDTMDSLRKGSLIDADGRDIPLQNFDISLKDVSFGYDAAKPILKNVSFEIPEGSTTAIVGPSGSGKTTICSLIARFYDVQKGSISVGGHDIRELTCDSLLQNISMVFQNVYLFHDTLRNNILFGNPDATEEEMIAAAKKAQCHDFILSLPDGYDTMVGEGGSTLSGGEKQRVSIARAILKNAPIVILDEATASIDPENEHLIQAAIAELTQGKTLIVIAHRLATIEGAQQILVLEDGEIAEHGTHEELLRSGGLYSKFVAIRRKAEGWTMQNNDRP